jgi:hypothetical protein
MEPNKSPNQIIVYQIIDRSGTKMDDELEWRIDEEEERSPTPEELAPEHHRNQPGTPPSQPVLGDYYIPKTSEPKTQDYRSPLSDLARTSWRDPTRGRPTKTVGPGRRSVERRRQSPSGPRGRTFPGSAQPGRARGSRLHSTLARGVTSWLRLRFGRRGRTNRLGTEASSGSRTFST